MGKRSLAIIVILMLLVSSIWWMTREGGLLSKPIKHYQVDTQMEYVQPAELDAVMANYLGDSFWQVNLVLLQAEIVRLDWVNHVEVKRSWPDKLVLHIREQKPVARWGENGLVNHQGHVFYPANHELFDNLVVLDGDLAQSATVLLKLIAFQELLSKINMTVAALTQQPDETWQIDCLDASRIVLDGQESEKRLDRFVRAYQKLPKVLRKSAQVYDLRYSNGFIVGNADLLPDEASSSTAEK